MYDFTFILQRFAVEISDGKVTIPAGESYERDGVIYTAISDAQLNLDDEGKVADGVVAGAIADAVKTEPDEGDNND